MSNAIDRRLMNNFLTLPMSVQFSVLYKVKSDRISLALCEMMCGVDECWNERGQRGPYQRWADEHPMHSCLPKPEGWGLDDYDEIPF